MRRHCKAAALELREAPGSWEDPAERQTFSRLIGWRLGGGAGAPLPRATGCRGTSECLAADWLRRQRAALRLVAKDATPRSSARRERRFVEGRAGRGEVLSVFSQHSLRSVAMSLLTLLWMFLQPLVSALKRGLKYLTPSSAEDKPSPPRSRRCRKRNRSKNGSHKRRRRRKGRAPDDTQGYPEKPYFAAPHQEVTAFLKLFDDDLLQKFLLMDRCCKIADKYLLAMTYIYFKRANFSTSEHTRLNFFVALYLAHTVEVDEEEPKYEIFPWALGQNWRELFPDFLMLRDQLWRRLGYQALVRRRCCEKVMALAPGHYLWQRERPEHHGGAISTYNVDQSQPPLGPGHSPLPCSLCGKKGRFVRLGLSSSSSSSSNSTLEVTRLCSFQDLTDTSSHKRLVDSSPSSAQSML
ncbi:LOW QUALITY PROTEIN: speedy protein A-like [Cyrtonyx montezumae]|uniref:LOW QUALITY PROTEIN: speedy protein A-like n=1 Tax=Cyrtonyx montezumae TaxID=9017 RepID=UPI0032DBB0CE